MRVLPNWRYVGTEKLGEYRNWGEIDKRDIV